MDAYLYNKTFDGEISHLSLSEIKNLSKVELLADINGPTPVKANPKSEKMINPFPDSYTIIGYGEYSNAAFRHCKRTGIVVVYLDGHVSNVSKTEVINTKLYNCGKNNDY